MQRPAMESFSDSARWKVAERVNLSLFLLLLEEKELLNPYSSVGNPVLEANLKQFDI